MRQILTDGGSSFKNKLIAELCKLFKIKHTISSPHHPQMDGKCERMNKTIIESLRLVCKDQTDWAQNVTPALMSYRATVASLSGISPHFALFGRNMNLGIDIGLIQDVEKSPDIQTYTANLLPKLKLTHSLLQQNLEHQAVTMKKSYDAKSEEPKLALGSKVWVHDPTTKTGECAKLERRWDGPYLIVDKTDDGLSYKLRHCETGKEKRSFIYYNRLKPYNADRDLFYSKHQLVSDTLKQSADEVCPPSNANGLVTLGLGVSPQGQKLKIR